MVKLSVKNIIILYSPDPKEMFGHINNNDVSIKLDFYLLVNPLPDHILDWFNLNQIAE